MSGHAVLFVPGAFYGPWCWDLVLERMEAAGVTCRCAELHRGGLAQDVAAVGGEVAPLAAKGQTVVVVGHSLGCTSLSELAPERVDHAVFLAPDWELA